MTDKIQGVNSAQTSAVSPVNEDAAKLEKKPVIEIGAEMIANKDNTGVGLTVEKTIKASDAVDVDLGVNAAKFTNAEGGRIGANADVSVKLSDTFDLQAGVEANRDSKYKSTSVSFTQTSEQSTMSAGAGADFNKTVALGNLGAGVKLNDNIKFNAGLSAGVEHTSGININVSLSEVAGGTENTSTINSKINSGTEFKIGPKAGVEVNLGKGLSLGADYNGAVKEGGINIKKSF